MATITEKELHIAEKNMTKEMQPHFRAIHVCHEANPSVDLSVITICLANGMAISIPTQLLEGLRDAKCTDLDTIEITPTGLGLYWPKLGIDLYVPGLLSGILGSKRWMAKIRGESGGRARSPVKSASSRKNGKKGDRPLKQSVAS